MTSNQWFSRHKMADEHLYSKRRWQHAQDPNPSNPLYIGFLHVLMQSPGDQFLTSVLTSLQCFQARDIYSPFHSSQCSHFLLSPDDQYFPKNRFSAHMDRERRTFMSKMKYNLILPKQNFEVKEIKSDLLTMWCLGKPGFFSTDCHLQQGLTSLKYFMMHSGWAGPQNRTYSYSVDGRINDLQT